MKILNPFSNKSFKYAFLITIILGSVYLVLRLLFFSTDPFLPLLEVAYEPYLNLAENLAGQLFKMHNADVIIKDHEFIFGNAATYELARSNFFEKWQEFLLYRNWSVLLLFLIWANVSTIRKKIVFSIFFVIAHFFSVVSGLYLLGITGPELFEYKPHYFLSPTLIGTFFMFVLLVAWFKISKDEILNTIQKLKIKIVISDRKINEIFVLLFVFLLLRSFIIDFFDFPHYVNFLLETTRRVSLLWHHEGHIYGDQLVGENGALALSKHCLAFMTMFVFASIVYVTRQKNIKATMIFLASGLVLLQISNVIRLVVVFVVAQGEDGFNRANRHHDIYNIGIYLLIFVMWVVWFEFFVGRKNLKPTIK